MATVDNDPQDHVRVEVETALRAGNIRVIPVLVRYASMPKPEDVPESVRALVTRNGASIRPNPDFQGDVSRLAKILRDLMIEESRNLRSKQPSHGERLRESLGTSQPNKVEARAERRQDGSTFPGKRRWPRVAAVVAALALVIVGAIYFSFSPLEANDTKLATAARHATIGRFSARNEGGRRGGRADQVCAFGHLITAEVSLRNTGSDPVTFPCEGWQLIDEQTSHVSKPDIEGGIITKEDIVFHSTFRAAPSNVAPLAPGATHVTWAKFKVEAGTLSSGKYAVNVESILNRPFEGLVPKSQ